MRARWHLRERVRRAEHGPGRLAVLCVCALLLLSLTAVSLLRPAGSVQAQSCDTTWTNASGGDWFVAANWSAGVPDATKDACITLAGSYTVTLSGGATAKAFLLGGAGSSPTLQVMATASSGAGLRATTALTNNGTIAVSARAEQSAGLAVIDASGAGGTLTNNGTITLDSPVGGRSGLGISANIINTASGTISIRGETGFDLNNATYTNLGTITIAAGATLDIGPYLVGATFQQNGGSLTVDGLFVMNYGRRFDFNGGVINGTVTLAEVALTLNTSTAGNFQLTGASTLSGDVSANQTLQVLGLGYIADGVLTAASSFTNNGTILLDGPYGVARLVVSSGTLTNTGTLILGSSLVCCGAVLEVVVRGGTLLNTGTITTGGEPEYLSKLDAPLDNYGSIITSINTTLSSPSGPPINEAGGTVEIAAGTLTLQGSAASLNNNGTLIVDAGATLAIPSGSLSNLSAGLLAGAGTVAANVSNDGFVAPGAADGTSTGILTIQGSYSQSSNGVLYLELCGTIAGTGYDRLAVSGSATLAGLLQVTTTNPSATCYTPALNDSFRVLTFASYTGDFVQPYVLPALAAGQMWSSTLAATFLDLTVVAGAAPSSPASAPRPVPARPRLPQRS